MTGPFTSQINVSGSGGINWFPAQTTISGRFYVFTAQQIGSTFQYRINGGRLEPASQSRHAGIHVSDL